MRQWMWSVVCAGLMATGSARAAGSGDEVRLVGTTVPGQAAHGTGQIDLTVRGTMIFRPDGSQGKQELVMPYAQVFEFGLRSEDAFHLGFFPAMFFGMVAPRPQRHVFTVSWHDADGAEQEATFEVSKRLSEHLMPVMYARARRACVRKEFGACAPVVPPPPPPPAPRAPLTPPVAATTP